MENQIFRDISTELDLNGPYLSFTTQPTTQTTSSPSTISYTGLATVSYGASVSSPENIGTLEYQWYEDGVGALTNGGNISGATTGTLTIANVTSGTDDNREFYLRATYVPSKLDYETGNPPNEPLDSNTVGITITPNVEIISQPVTRNAPVNTNTTFTVGADLTDGTTAGLLYQWYVDGDAETDRTKTVTITNSTTESTPHSYSWNGPADHNLPTTASSIQTTIVGASGGNGGSDANGSGVPGGNGRGGTFNLIDSAVQGKTLQYRIGNQGNGGGSCPNCYGNGGTVPGPASANGTRGGNSGPRGWSGGGGGAGAASYINVEPSWVTIICAGGGAGGGGGSHNRGAISNPEIAGRPFSAVSSPFSLSPGQKTGDFDHYGGDGGGSGGGGGGSPGGDTGNRGWDNNHGGYSGKGGGSRFNNSFASKIREFEHGGSGYASLSYDSTSTTTSTETRRTTFSGTNTPTLTVSSDWNGTQTIYCKITHPTAGNSPVDTDSVTFTATGTPVDNEIKAEHIGITGTATLETVNLSNGDVTWGTVTGIADDAGQQNVISFYSPDKDMTVQLDMYGGVGDPHVDGGKTGGEGGYSRIQFTMTQNQEYVIAGLSTYIGAPSLYRGANLIAVTGQGGAAGATGDGGDGGGCNVDGDSGLGAGRGVGGLKGGIDGNGIFGSIYKSGVVYSGDAQATDHRGGKMIICPKGVYWRQQGKSQCESLGTQQYRLGNGDLVSNTGSITRGYKGGYNIIQTAGETSGSGGRGGCGVKGGDGASGSGGGGGGSGFADTGMVTIVDAQLGGSTDYAKVVLRVVT